MRLRDRIQAYAIICVLLGVALLVTTLLKKLGM